MEAAVQFAEQPVLYSYEQLSARTMVPARAGEESVKATPRADAPTNQWSERSMGDLNRWSDRPSRRRHDGCWRCWGDLRTLRARHRRDASGSPQGRFKARIERGAGGGESRRRCSRQCAARLAEYETYARTLGARRHLHGSVQAGAGVEQSAQVTHVDWQVVVQSPSSSLQLLPGHAP
jgi:hypothetical protein